MQKASIKEVASIVMAIVLLLCLFPLPYGCFVLVRMLATVLFGYLAYDFYQRGATAACVVGVLIAILFQPIAKVTFSREVWQVIDLIVALLLFGNVIWDRMQSVVGRVSKGNIEMPAVDGCDVFISYSTKDHHDMFGRPNPHSVVSEIQAALDAAGITYWIDNQGLSAGVLFSQEIAKQIYGCKVFLFVSSENSNQSAWTMNEIATANSYGKTIIPLRIDDTQFAPSIMIYVAGLQYINYYMHPQMAKFQLISTIKQVIS